MIVPRARAVALAAAALLAVAIIAMAPRPLRQPLSFNHRLHLEDVGLECVDCHRYVLSGPRATIPNIEVCLDCHEEAQTESPEEVKLVGFIETATPIPWQKVYRLPNHVYFSHRMHAAIAGIECEACHGPVGDSVMPVRRPFRPLTMDECMDCHDESGASNDCIFCHY